MTDAVLLAALAVTSLIILERYGPHTLVVAALVVSLAIYPAQLTRSGETSNTGLAADIPTISTFTIALLVALLALKGRGASRRIRILIVPFGLFLAAGLFWWPLTALTIAGYLELVIGGLAWLVGARLGAQAGVGDGHERRMIGMIMIALLFQLTLSLLQLAGLELFPLDPQTAALMGSRTHGSLNHPNNLGKVALLLSALALPYTGSAVKATARRAWVAVATGFVVEGLTVGRATIVAFLVMLLVYLFTARAHKKLSVRITWTMPIVLAASAFAPSLIQRFEEDPDGGSRDVLAERALDYLQSHLFSGVGPNNYVHAINSAFGSGTLPVHNSFLLAAVELGILGCVLLFLPFLVTLALATRIARRKSERSRSAAALLALQLGLVPVLATGWGMVSTYIFPLWCLVVAFLASSMLQQAPERERTAETRMSNVFT